MVKAFSPLFIPLCKLKLSRRGFTLIELLVVIGIIAILASVAIGPITRGLKSAAQSKGLQTARSLALAEFQYANDNNTSYPDSGNTGANSGGISAESVANCLVNGGYIVDPSIFYINGSAESKYTGTTTGGNVTIPATNISWDFCGASNGLGVNPNTPDQVPLVWSSNTASVTTSALQTAVTGSTGASISLLSTNPFGSAGMAVCFKSNSASFLVATPTSSGGGTLTTLFPAGYPGWTSATALPGGG